MPLRQVTASTNGLVFAGRCVKVPPPLSARVLSCGSLVRISQLQVMLLPVVLPMVVGREI